MYAASLVSDSTPQISVCRFLSKSFHCVKQLCRFFYISLIYPSAHWWIEQPIANVTPFAPCDVLINGGDKCFHGIHIVSAGSQGMLEPTKEPVKPVSAAEMIAAIAMTMACPSDAVQVSEALPPVQFDWSSSGLTNPLDGVDPELYELTTSKLDTNTSSGSRVADAFARLMSTMEKTSTSTRKPRKEENLSEEAEKVISALPDLSFMQAKVLMFPSTLTPLNCRD
uniref:Aftiphilin clathrin-binding box domain-containing protein n=1 Tax=Cynoglossus semilaevis TaxID=244447 RepID=A0A3P8X5K1_CYNSE